MKSPTNLEGYFLNLKKGMYRKLTANIVLNGEGLECSPKMKNKTKCLLLMMRQFLPWQLGEKKTQKVSMLQRRNKIISLHWWHNLAIENLKESIREPLEWKNNFNEVVGFKINMQKLLVVPYTCTEQSESESKKTNSQGAWLGQPLERTTLDLGVMHLSPTLGVEVT